MKLLLSQALQVILPSGDALDLAPRDAAVLAWLALEGPTPRARLAGLLWPESDTEAARRSLRQRLHHLRKSVGSELIEGDDTLALVQGVSHDLDDADTVLGDHAHDYSPTFGLWLRRQREQRVDRMRHALTELAEMAERAHDHADALVHARELLTLSPRSEAAHRRVMRLHYLCGDRAAALLAFDRCEQVLKDEVGARPSADTLALLATIERAAPDDALRPAVSMPAALQRPPRLIGRDAERRALARCVDDAAVLLLAGQAGMGKSRLIADLVGSDTTRFSMQRAHPGDSFAPYALAARWLRGLLLREGVQADAGQRGELAQLLPEFGPPPERQRQDDRARLICTMRALAEAAVQRGLRAVVIDDLQFADTVSVELLHALAGSTPCAWIFAMRPDELGAAALALVDAQSASTTASTVTLQPLGVDAMAALLDSLAIEGVGGLAQAQVLHQRTGGNPMFLLETLKSALAAHRGVGFPPGAASALAWPRADTVQRLIQQRLTRLDPLALKLVRCAALAGPDFSPRLAAEVLRLQPLDLTDAWSRLEDAQVLREGAFAHDLIAEAALGLVPQAIAQALHAEIGGLLERRGGEPARIAAHWVAAAEPGKAVPHLNEAGRRAHAAWQRAEAARFHEQAAIILRGAGDRRGAFDAYFAAAAAGRNEDQVGLAAFGQALLALADDEGQRAAAAWVPATVLLAEGKFDAARTAALQTLPLAQRADLPDIEVELLWILALVCMYGHDLDAAARYVEQALARLPDVDPATARLARFDMRFLLSDGLAWVLAMAGRYPEADALLVRTLNEARQEGEWAHIGEATYMLAGNALEQGRLEQSSDWWAQAAAAEDRFEGDMSLRVKMAGGRAQVLALAADLGGALVAAETAVRMCDKAMQRFEPFARKRLHWLQFELGRPDLALKGLREMRERTDLPPDERVAVEADLLRLGDSIDGAALLEQTLGFPHLTPRVRILCVIQPHCDPLRVLPVLSAAADAARSRGAHGLWLSLQTRHVAALHAAGRADEAQAQALAVWQRVEEGVAGIEMFPRMAGDLCAALALSHPDLAQAIAARAWAWMHQAAATLPPAWRESYVLRAPVLQNLPPAGRGALLSPPPRGTR